MSEHMKECFIKLAIECQVLRFGEFTLKSGRISPYFFNAGLFYEGKALQQIGQFYADTLINSQLKFKHLFGPAYKGLPLATTTAVALAAKNIDVTVTFNRKEVKNHGEGGALIGAPLQGQTIIIDDVITAGTAFREAQQLITQNGGQLAGVIIALDRCERGISDQSALQEIVNQGIPIFSLITFFDLLNYLKRQGQTEQVERLLAYHEQFGCKPAET
ncbi:MULTISPECIES: orotate phosphoribosyltransferase [Legionella]|uniref:orotate phosphoribosyltransferase n=1 Tax=Legionella TaxID=445 RepID=UPI000F8E1D2C|nr:MULTISPECIES: orotate phosphoribosyltransferase [Legionella]MCP0913552.1 orotate phosphoribosyltransferase [Legionella sp. 27cVA30]RUQ99780.1 orotate phosphoribosyltransferase [Legionella septentrionalis]RUR11026.1 orotate phosphoribosyltransferase [Legionella septentrionalis]